MSSYVFQFFCGDGKAGAPTPSQPTQAQVPPQPALAAPPPRPRASTAPHIGRDVYNYRPGFKKGRCLGGAGGAALPATAQKADPGLRALYRYPQHFLRANGGTSHHRPACTFSPEYAKLAHLAVLPTPKAVSATCTSRLVSPTVAVASSCSASASHPMSVPAAHFRPAPQRDDRKPAHPGKAPLASTKRQQARGDQSNTRAQASASFPASPQAPFQAERQAAPAAQKSSSPGAVVQAVDAKNVDEQFLKDLMSADVEDVSSQLEIQLQGRTAVDHIPEGLSTLSQSLLYREQLLENPYPDQWVMAPWQALRTNADRAMLIRQYQRPFSSLRDPERDRCARYLLSLFSEPVPPNTIGRSEFFGFIDCILQSRLNNERHLTEGATWSRTGGKCGRVQVSLRGFSWNPACCPILAPVGSCHHQRRSNGHFGHRQGPAHRPYSCMSGSGGGHLLLFRAEYSQS